MKPGTCALCTKTRKLVKSHLFAKALNRLETPGVVDPRPIMITSEAAELSRRGITSPLLCGPCDAQLATRGEEWMIENAFDGKSFRLLEKLRLAIPVAAYSRPGVHGYSADWLGIDTCKAAYFALSMLWRTSIRQWWIPGNETIFVGLNDSYSEDLRRYLRGETGFPQNVAVRMTICSDRLSHGMFVPPCEIFDETYRRPTYGFVAMGLIFDSAVGEDIPHQILQQCCVRSQRKVVFMQDCSRITFHLMQLALKTSIISKDLLELTPGAH